MFILWLPWVTRVIDAIFLAVTLYTVWWMHKRGLRGSWQFWWYLAGITSFIASWWLSGIAEIIATLIQVVFSGIMLVLVAKSIVRMRSQRKMIDQSREMEQYN